MKLSHIVLLGAGLMLLSKVTNGSEATITNPSSTPAPSTQIMGSDIQDRINALTSAYHTAQAPLEQQYEFLFGQLRMVALSGNQFNQSSGVMSLNQQFWNVRDQLKALTSSYQNQLGSLRSML